MCTFQPDPSWGLGSGRTDGVHIATGACIQRLCGYGHLALLDFWSHSWQDLGIIGCRSSAMSLVLHVPSDLLTLHFIMKQPGLNRRKESKIQQIILFRFSKSFSHVDRNWVCGQEPPIYFYSSGEVSRTPAISHPQGFSCVGLGPASKSHCWWT